MQNVAYPCLMMAAIALYLSGYHLVMYLKRRAATAHLPFSLLCLSVAAYDLFCVGLYSARSLSEGIPWQRLQLQTVNLISAFTIWFVASHVGRQRSLVLRLLMVWFGLLLVLSVALPSEVLVSSLRPAVRTVQVFGDLRATYYEGEVGNANLVALLSSVLAYAYLLKLLVSHYRETRSRQTAVIIAGQVAFFGGVLNDTLASARLHSHLYLSEYAFLLVIFSMAYVLLDEFVGLYAAVEEANRGLEAKIAERTSALMRRNAEMRLVLDTVSEGLVTIDREGNVTGERSAAFDRWFGAPAPGGAFAGHLARFAPNLEAPLRLCWRQLVENVLPLEVNLQQMPSRMVVGDASYALRFTPLLDDENVNGALVTISDVSSVLAAQRAEAAEREFARVFERAVRDRHGFTAFLAEAGELVAQVTRSAGDTAGALHALHTLKGNCGVFGVESVAAAAHDLESSVRDEPRRLEQADLARLNEAWARLTERLSVLTEAKTDDRVEVSHAEIDDLAKVALGPTSRDGVARAIRELKYESVALRFERFKLQIEGLAERLGKPRPRVITDGGGLRLPARRWAAFWGAFVHLLRNAVDHGLEQGEARQKAGKSVAGTLTLTARTEGQLLIEVRDDGGGISWDALKLRAERVGLATNDDAALVEALFADGVSTATNVSAVSGRGVGLGAVREAALGLGGSVEVESVAGVGTAFRFRFPRPPQFGGA
jgi:HPt (histidine-containing phosphotransfer) domain-containing protein